MSNYLYGSNYLAHCRLNGIKIGEHVKQVVYFNAYKAICLEYTGRAHHFTGDILCTGISGLCLCNKPWRDDVLTTDLQVSIDQRNRDFYFKVVPSPAEILLLCVLKTTEEWNEVYDFIIENPAQEGWLARGRLMRTAFYTDQDELFTCERIDSI
jgi:hypothetical protein